MAGHSKWANIKHRKAAQDAKRGKAFSGVIKKISSAARRGGGDPDTNPELRLYMQKARAVNMPKDVVERAVLKATGQLEGVSYEDIRLEGYGSGGVAIFLEGSTDNRNRTVANVRHAFSKNGGNMGTDGCVAWMFHTKGILNIAADQVSDADEIMEIALENGAEDFEDADGVFSITCEAEDFEAIRNALVAHGIETFMTDEITKIAENQIEPSLQEVKKVMKLLEMLEEDDDIEQVYHNMDLSDEVAAALAAE